MGENDKTVDLHVHHIYICKSMKYDDMTSHLVSFVLFFGHHGH